MCHHTAPDFHSVGSFRALPTSLLPTDSKEEQVPQWGKPQGHPSTPFRMKMPIGLSAAPLKLYSKQTRLYCHFLAQPELRKVSPKEDGTADAHNAVGVEQGFHQGIFLQGSYDRFRFAWGLLFVLLHPTEPQDSPRHLGMPG